MNAARLRAHRGVNTELLRLYWAIGTAMRNEAEGWRTRVIDRLTKDLRSAVFPQAGPVPVEPEIHAPDAGRVAGPDWLAGLVVSPKCVWSRD